MGILPMIDSQENHGLEGRATSFFNGLLSDKLLDSSATTAVAWPATAASNAGLRAGFAYQFSTQDLRYALPFRQPTPRAAWFYAD